MILEDLQMFRMAQTYTAEKSRWWLIVPLMTLGLIYLAQSGCDSDPSNPFTPLPPLPSGITVVFPAPDSDNAQVSTIVSVRFDVDMSGTTINTSTFTLTVAGAPVDLTSVVYDEVTRTATLTPAADLISDTEYNATLSSAIQTVAGDNPLTADFVWSFTTSPATFLVSKDSDAVVGNDVSLRSAIDATGRYIVFESNATTLTPGTTITRNRNHIYKKDTVTGDIVLVSSDAAGREANNDSFSPRISADGRFVVFESLATNLTPIATGGTRQVYIKDLADDTVELASQNEFRVVANATVENPDVSNDGNFVVFESSATNLTGESTNAATQIYLRDRFNNTVEMLTAGGTGDSNRSFMSPDAQYVVFDSEAGDSIVSGALATRSVFLVDRTSSPNVTELVSVNTNGEQGNGLSTNASVSDDGRFIVFESQASNLIAGGTTLFDIYRRDRQDLEDLFDGETLLVSTPDGSTSGDGVSVNASISSDGTYVAFQSAARNLASETQPGFVDIFVRNFSTSPATVTITKINLTQTGAEATDNSGNAAISSDGRYVSFDSAFNFDIIDTNSISDVYRSHNSNFSQ
ncbi:MAG: Ig-like domain-containing protein [Gammaproteobacteria bacterium]